jgi:probable O-glycosylation ligase (exosortase A-associated)
MRDLLLFGIIFSLIPVCFIRPWIGVLVFSWISYMNPHRLTWTAAYDYPFAKIVAIVTILGLFLTSDRMRLPKTREVFLMILLGIYFTGTNYFAFNPDAAWLQWQKVIKILVMTFVTMILINDPRKLKYLVIVIVFSIAFFGIKGAIFSLATGGNYRVYGPMDSFFYENNDMALALNMILPMLFFLSKDEENINLRNIFKFSFVMCFIAVIFTYSRGGFLTLAAVSAMLFLKSKHKTVAIVIASMGIIVATSYIPQEWFERIESIRTYEEDNSAMGRINAWQTAYNMAKDRPLTGGGFEAFNWKAFNLYSPNPSNVHDVHSIYFEVLGEHGFVAFGLFAALMLFTLSTAQKLKKQSKQHENLRWVTNYSDMFRVSIFAYMVGGVFLGRAYFDLFYHIVAMVVIMKVLLEKELSQIAAISVKEQKRSAGYKTNALL